MQPPSKWTIQALRNHIRALVNMTADRQTLLLVYQILKSDASVRRKIVECMDNKSVI